jgi:hypothetical protein
MNLIMSILFICKNIFFIFNRVSLNSPFSREKLGMFNFIYYILSFIYPLWVGFNTIANGGGIFIALSSVILLKFPLYHLNRPFYDKFIIIEPYLNSALLSFFIFD